jgi:hypothetical protein
MAAQGHGKHQLKRIVLPSGKTIEVVYFDHPATAPADPPPAPRQRPAEPKRGRRKAAPKERRELHLCPSCSSHLVYPTHWEEADERSWRVTLRCPNCEWGEEAVFAQGVCDRFDDELERGTDALARDYKRLVTANLAEEIDRFARALEVDGIMPMDF